MQRIAYSSSFVPFENQRITTSGGVFAVNKYECFMENKNIKTFSGCKLSKKKTTLNLINILLVIKNKEARY